EETTEYDYVGDVDGLEVIWETLRGLGDWDTLTLSGVPAGSPLTYRLSERALRDLAITAIERSSRSPYITLPGYESRIPNKLRVNLRRWRKKMGTLELTRVTEFSHADFADSLRIEEMAWKGADGISISSRPELRHFYNALSRIAAHHAELNVYFLSTDGQRFAFVFALEDDDTLYAMRTGYDPEFAKLGPGHLLFDEVARDAEQRGLLELNFMGKESDWKRRWTHLAHDHVVSVTYRPTVRGTSRFVGRELVKPRLSPKLLTRVRHTREQVARVFRHCQRNDLVGEHSLGDVVRGRLNSGLRIRTGAKRLFLRSPRPPRKLGRASRFNPGDWVRVVDEERLRATLDAEGKLRGLAFLDYQYPTCGRRYRVQERCRRIADDAGQMRAVDETVLLEGATCDGEGGSGCGRHCPMMYRDEWLEPVSAPEEVAEEATEGWATVAPLETIRAGLDRRGRRDGVTFMPEMERYVGRRLPILRRIDQVHELGAWTPTKAPLRQLEGARCTGADLGFAAPCHRACLFLWHPDWLVIEPPSETTA
ncbi:MAG: GNAT family N-acetyltransferase, partial [Myxococcales bacterium]|nr:GNAT family N-acetyltransferase [Myxococcales bacterium]